MGVINKQTQKYIIVGILLLVEVMTISLLYKSYGYRNNELDEINMLGKNSGLFAIYIKEAGETEYERSRDDEFPSGFYLLDETRSGCMDNVGNSLEDVTISYEAGEIEVKTNQSAYCYLYFYFYITASQLDYDNTIVNKTTCTDAQCAIDELYELHSGKSQELIAGLYRYQGTNAFNYICFGTTNKNTCINDTDKYMYRIIGVDENGQMKLIKKEALNNNYTWHSANTNTTWPNSSLFNGLNGSYFLTNPDYVPNSSWSNRIATVNWKYGDITDTSITALSDIVTAEQNFTDSVSAKIGLLSLHDYLYSNEDARFSWLKLNRSGNDTNAPNFKYEWTMTRYGITGDISENYYQAWLIDTHTMTSSNVQLYAGAYFIMASVRPVFYLTSSQEIVSGSGTMSDPYILNN